MNYGSFSSSTDVEKLSLTIKGLVGSLLPVLHLITGVEIFSAKTDALIDAVLLLITTAITAYGYIRSKKILGAKIRQLGGQIQSQPLASD